MMRIINNNEQQQLKQKYTHFFIVGSIFATGNNTNSNTSSLFSANQGQSDNKGMNSSPFGTAGIFGKSDGSNPFNNSEPKK